MSASILRQAAHAIREEDYPPIVGKALVAWLRAAADDREAQPYLKQSWDDASIADADAILGGAA